MKTRISFVLPAVWLTRDAIEILILSHFVHTDGNTGITSQMGTKLRDFAVGQAVAGCYSWTALSSSQKTQRPGTTVSKKFDLLICSQTHINHAECMNPPGGVLRRLHGGGLKFQNGVGEEEGGDAQRGLKQRGRKGNK